MGGGKTPQFSDYVTEIHHKVKQQPLYGNAHSLVVQGLLLVYFSILSSALRYFSDLKENKNFTSIQRYAFNLLQSDVHKYQTLLGPALKNLDKIPPFKKEYGEHRYIHQKYIPLVNLSRTYLPEGPYECVWPENMVYSVRFFDGGADGEPIDKITQYCKHPGQYQKQIAENKQVIMQELGKEITDFYYVCNSCGNLWRDDFFYWFGYVLNSIWQGDTPFFTNPWPYYSKQVMELLTATKKMGSKYFDSASAELYMDMIEQHAGFPPIFWSKTEWSNMRQNLLGNADIHQR